MLTDWELGRGTETCYGFLGGSDPGAFLVAKVADVARLKRAGSGFFGLLSLPGLRAPLVEFLGQPRVSDFAAPSDGLPMAAHKRLAFAAPAGRKSTLVPLSFAWLVDEERASAAASKNADAVLKLVEQSARGEHDTLGTKPGFADSVQRIGEQAALFAYLDARVPLGTSGEPTAFPAPLLFRSANVSTARHYASRSQNLPLTSRSRARSDIDVSFAGETLLLTGFPGFHARKLALHLLALEPDVKLVLLRRASDSERSAECLARSSRLSGRACAS